MIKYLDFKSKKEFSNTQIIPALLKVGLYSKARKLKTCGNYSEVAVCTDCHSAHFAGATSCKDKFCPICQKKRSLLWLTKMIPICNDLLDKGYHLNMLTYTIRTTEDMSLKQCLDFLYNGFRYMTHDDKVSSKQYYDLIIGGVRSLEVKMGEDKVTKQSTNKWHPHFHILVCTRNEKRYEDLHKLLYDMWNKSLNVVNHTQGLDLGGIDIKSIKAKNNQTMLDALCEVFKYMTKFDWQGDKVYELVTTMHKVKMQNSFGNFRNLIKDQEIEVEMNKTYTEIEKNFCSVCGNDEFAIATVMYNKNLQLYDLSNKYSSLKTTDLILHEYMESENG